MNQYINDSTSEVTRESEQLISMKHIQEKILNESNEFALQIANSINNQERPPDEFLGIILKNSQDNQFELLKFQLVLDFLKCIGCKFTPAVFLHESQNPSMQLDRSHVSEMLHLRSYDKTPLLVQLIEIIRDIQKEQ